MNKIIKTYIIILCCILALKSIAFSSHFVICDFSSQSNVEILHTPKVAHDHNEVSKNNTNENHSSCNSESTENQCSECPPCSDTYIYNEANVYKKRFSDEIDFSISYSFVEKISLAESIVNNYFIGNTDNIQIAYQPTITVLRI
jgi:hypothetical protein